MKYWILLFLFLYLASGCDQKAGTPPKMESISSGYINISVDESFEPVIKEQIKVFQSSYPEAVINASFKTEADCLRDLQTDSTRMVIVSRGLNIEEQDFYAKKLQFNASFARVALDAIAIVVNSSSPDSVFTIEQLRQMLAGKSEKDYNIVVDGNGLTSTVRYLKDTLLKGQPLGKNVTAAKTSEGVIDYIANTTNAIGFVGISWLNKWKEKNPALASKVRMGLVECKNCEIDTYAKPSQQTILFRQYPLVRGLYYILKENFAGVGSGFSNFLSLERGQLIFSRANLVPSLMQFNRRRSQIKESE